MSRVCVSFIFLAPEHISITFCKGANYNDKHECEIYIILTFYKQLIGYFDTWNKDGIWYLKDRSFDEVISH